MDYIPHGREDIRQMLEALEISSVDDLYPDIPGKIRAGGYGIAGGISEQEVRGTLEKFAGMNASVRTLKSYAGGGAYEHFIPAIIDDICSKPEFYTAYTPYQPEASQGILQSIYEYQSMICELTGTDVSNASLYDGATAAAEAALISVNKYDGGVVAVSSAVNPMYRRVIETYLRSSPCRVEIVEHTEGVTDISRIGKHLSGKLVSFIFQSPNFFGCIEDVKSLSDCIHDKGALSIAVANPLSLGVLEAPGRNGADIVVGEGQPLGIPLCFGGPYLGFIGVKKELMRKLPGRIIGRTLDKDGKEGFVMTLQAREQHIRREKATSNICSNQALMALRAAVYMAYMGKEGMKKVGALNICNSHYLAEQIEKTGKAALKFRKPFFNEFVVEFKKDTAEVLRLFEKEKILPGIQVGEAGRNSLLCCVTETKTKGDMDKYADVVSKL
ncbi:MAG: aminomethyl-transferring glycine dehydrogenase subunit GcvPA [Candidatus Aureabacteria bacterium]|nr:aminomethyl-transferring glycine dehydrogenase subunit GcvPA [Candidatus Auribacterota bacterium]